MSRVFTVEVEDPRSRVLAVTNLWPDVERPVYGIFVKRQVESLRKFGIYVDVLYVRGKASGLAYPRAAVSMAIKGLQARRRYELIHVHAGETGLAARFLLGVPMLISYLGDDLLGDPRANGTLKPRSVARSWVIRQHSRFFSATITKSAEMEHVLPSRVRERNIVLPNGVDPDLFRPLDQDNCRRELGWGLDEHVALFVGDPAIERKRFWLAEAAHARAQEELGPIRLHVATTVSPDEMPVLMNAADVLLFPSALEGSPNAVKEALMCNLPVIASDVGDIAQLLEGVEPSYMRDPTVEAYAAALGAALSERKRSNGRAQSEELTNDAIARRLVTLYARLAPTLVPVVEPERRQDPEGVSA